VSNVLYHVKYEDDKAAEQVAARMAPEVRALGGELHISRSFTYGPAYLVVALPEEVQPEALFPGEDITRVEDGMVQTPAAQNPGNGEYGV
jgi:hypothetical protein